MQEREDSDAEIPLDKLIEAGKRLAASVASRKRSDATEETIAKYMLAMRESVVAGRSDFTGARRFGISTPWFYVGVSTKVHKEDNTYGWGVVFHRYESEAQVFADDRERAQDAILDCIKEREDLLRTIGDTRGANELIDVYYAVEEMEWPR